MLYLVAVVEIPTKKDADENLALEKLILEPTAIVARDDKSASAIAIQRNQDKFANVNMDRVEVRVRPF